MNSTFHDPAKCQSHVFTGVWSRMHQCSRKATKEGFCHQHHPDAVKKRERAKKQRDHVKHQRSPYTILSKVALQAATMRRALKAIAKGDMCENDGIGCMCVEKAERTLKRLKMI